MRNQPEIRTTQRQCKFEVLVHSWSNGFENSLADDEGIPIVFDNIEDAVNRLQRDFNILTEQMRTGEREPEDIFEEEEFLIRCVNTGTQCKITLVLGVVFLILDNGEFLRQSDYVLTNHTGLFKSSGDRQPG